MTFSVFEGHSPIASLLRVIFRSLFVARRAVPVSLQSFLLGHLLRDDV